MGCRAARFFRQRAEFEDVKYKVERTENLGVLEETLVLSWKLPVGLCGVVHFFLCLTAHNIMTFLAFSFFYFSAFLPSQSRAEFPLYRRDDSLFIMDMSHLGLRRFSLTGKRQFKQLMAEFMM